MKDSLFAGVIASSTVAATSNDDYTMIISNVVNAIIALIIYFLNKKKGD